MGVPNKSVILMRKTTKIQPRTFFLRKTEGF